MNDLDYGPHNKMIRIASPGNSVKKINDYFARAPKEYGDSAQVITQNNNLRTDF